MNMIVATTVVHDDDHDDADEDHDDDHDDDDDDVKRQHTCCQLHIVRDKSKTQIETGTTHHQDFWEENIFLRSFCSFSLPQM